MIYLATGIGQIVFVISVTVLLVLLVRRTKQVVYEDAPTDLVRWRKKYHKIGFILFLVLLAGGIMIDAARSKPGDGVVDIAFGIPFMAAFVWFSLQLWLNVVGAHTLRRCRRRAAKLLPIEQRPVIEKVSGTLILLTLVWIAEILIMLYAVFFAIVVLFFD